MNENVNVCITPKGEKPVLHFSQFDNERVFTVTVLADDGESAAVLTGLDIEFRIRKTDSHVVTIAPESVADNVITFKTTEQMCACCGQNIASVVLMKDELIISTLDILVDIQRDILSGGLTSESDIRNLTTQIEQIVPEVVGDNYYDKSEVDNLIAEHTFDPSNYYDKSEVDDLISEHTFEPTNYYDKSEVDDLLDDKADTSAIASLIVQKDVAKAPIASFNTDLNDNLTKCLVDINPVQSGTGTPSPQNVRPISGFSALNVTRTGVNLCYQVISGASISGGGQIVSEPSYAMGCALLKKGVTYTVTTQEGQLVGGYFSSSPTIGSTAYDNTRFVLSNKTITPTKDCYIAFRMPSNYTTQPQVNIGSTVLPYVAYNGQTATVNFGQTVYGGQVDVTGGSAVSKMQMLDIANINIIKNTSNPNDYLYYTTLGTTYDKNGHGICSHLEEKTQAPTGSTTGFYISQQYNVIYINIGVLAQNDVAGFKAFCANNNVQLLLDKLTPIEITTTPENLTAISGQTNNVYGDTNGDIAVRFTETIGNELGV